MGTPITPAQLVQALLPTDRLDEETLHAAGADIELLDAVARMFDPDYLVRGDSRIESFDPIIFTEQARHRPVGQTWLTILTQAGIPPQVATIPILCTRWHRPGDLTPHTHVTIYWSRSSLYRWVVWSAVCDERTAHLEKETVKPFSSTEDICEYLSQIVPDGWDHGHSEGVAHARHFPLMITGALIESVRQTLEKRRHALERSETDLTRATTLFDRVNFPLPLTEY